MATITRTLTDMVTTTVTSSTSTSTARAAAQGGILEGLNPTVYNPSNPIILFIIQASIIVVFCRLLHYPLSLLRQPRVIAEVIGGILLGPSVMGRIPGFSNAIFPKDSLPNLSLVANLGLVLFLFIVGLEVDMRFFVKNWRVAVSVSVAGMALPFGLGCAIAWGLFNSFHDEPGTKPIAFGTYMLFIGVAMAITAFPVLCRILTDLKLLSTDVGVIVLSAGVGNDVVGWILLALCVALVNAGSGITALWVLLTCLGYTLFLAFAVRPGFLWLLRKTRSLEDGPSQTIIAFTLLMTLASAFFTGVIGVHPIFGAFLAGLICPHEGGFAIKVTEKVEDLVSALFLPLYFALSGLSTNLGLLNNGITWGYVFAVIAIAFLAKFIGCSIAARLNGLVWRESFAVGALMSCKGLVELIVLNIGLQAKILSQRTFTIFVVMALVTTFATTPLTVALYPAWYQRKLETWRRRDVDWDGSPAEDDKSPFDAVNVDKLKASKVKHLLVYLRLDSMAPLLSFVSLLGARPSDSGEKRHPKYPGTVHVEEVSNAGRTSGPVEVHGIRLLELTERSSTVMKVSELDEYATFDPVINTFKVLAQLYNLAVSGEVSIVPESSYAESLVTKASEESADLLLLPWSETGSLSETQTVSHHSTQHKMASNSYTTFVSKALEQGATNVAVFINKGFNGTVTNEDRAPPLTRTFSSPSIQKERIVTKPNTDRSHHIFLPFFGGADGRLALRLVLQLAENPDCTATIVHYKDLSQIQSCTEAVTTKSSQIQTRSTDIEDAVFFATLQRSLPAELERRVFFDSVSSEAPSDDALARARLEIEDNHTAGGNVIVIGRRTAVAAARTSCLGSVADMVLASGLRASLLVVQARYGDNKK